MECGVTKMKNILFVSAIRRMLKPLILGVCLFPFLGDESIDQKKSSQAL